ncbi:CheR family methyltransferase [Nitrosomonas ureae]|uniref:Chemotaxis protein methyltransferase n=1 Tax=Nitrosomonas ureae TaxID=44577 RepID=A0A0S3AKY7_9PROT|nr:CheR family methyltransferase [Nitrosomonas ureae]ALQ51844.1 chemotaxis protein CheR [Nitrosomonas ureae]PTQ80050.1 CheR-type MCP methyltransferase [Nitrosomonas ureae]PXX06710.1 CheR-type MCP methyltransferase [Nitrosomonas ureae]SDU15891.1 MCP methyltransferase, CheR-type [Nitrosomonas ureae]SEP69210.1 chemotaxis protein methyltransferase CheR [Nitrosomonas ureae]
MGLITNIEDNSDSKGREYNFTQADFERIRKLIYKHAGISLSTGKQNMVYSRLARRLRATGLDSFNEYLDYLERGNPEEWEAFTNALTTNLTAFFREQHHFPILERHVEKRKNHDKIQLWCSASSTGEEPYSMAMAMVQAFKSYTPPVHILATDLDTNVLAKAQMGIYSLDKLEKLPKEKLKQFFLKGKGSHDGSARVRPELRNMITFRKLNLLDDNWPIRGPFDAIFCRNVMIYFDKQTQYKILKKFVPLLASDGLLFAGHSESFQHAIDLFKLREKTVYELANRKR